MYNAFYQELIDIKTEMIDEGLEDEVDEINFGFMENLCDSFYQDELGVINLEKYLHGYCDEFAMLLNTKYNYQIEVIFFCHRIIHAYCKFGNYYIDVRGITDDEELFYSEFKEELKKETHRVTFDSTKECFDELCDWCGLNYHIVNKKELALLANDRYLSYYYDLNLLN